MTHLPRGVRPGGLKASKWASAPDSSSWATRGPSHYVPRSSAINPAVPVTSDAPTTSAAPDNDRWWENTPTPRLKRELAAPSGARVRSGHTVPSGSSTELASAQREFRRYVQIVRRMKWKLPYLQHGYHLAVDGRGADLSPSSCVSPEQLAQRENERQEAELMFKLDFYEYYMLLERALVHLLGVFGITVSSGRSHTNGNGSGRTHENANGAARSTHQYHHNVLAALDSKQNPLHPVLGVGEVRQHLLRAKELRNRWKYVDDPAEPGAARANGASTRGEGDLDRITGRAPLESYDLDSMFASIFDGFDQGYAIAEAWIDDLAHRANMVPDPDMSAAQVRRLAEEEAEFDFIVDAMDWEAV